MLPPAPTITIYVDISLLVQHRDRSDRPFLSHGSRGLLVRDRGGLSTRSAAVEREDLAITRRPHPEIPPLPGRREWHPVILPNVVAGDVERPPRTLFEINIEVLRSAELKAAQHIGPLHRRLKRPLMSFNAEDLILFIEGAEDMDSDRITRMGLDDRGCQTSRLRRHTGGEHISRLAAMLFAEHPWLAPVVDTGESADLLDVGHKGCPDDIILILEEERRISEVRPSCILRNRPIDDHIGLPGVLHCYIVPGNRITIFRSFRPHDNGAE